MNSIISEAPGRRTRAPLHLWIVGVVAVLWNAMGAFDFTATQFQLSFYMDQFTEEQLAYFYAFPLWINAAWAVAVFGALIGSAGLLLRKAWALWLFVFSLVAMLITMFYTLVLTDGIAIMGTAGAIFSLVIVVVAILLVFYTRAMISRRVLR